MNFKIFLISCFLFGILCEDSIDNKLSENEKYLKYKIEQLQDHFQRSLSEMNKQITDLKNSGNHNSKGCDQGWFAYLNQKCFKVIEEKANFDQSLLACKSLDEQATLPSIHSNEELLLLTNELANYTNSANNVWIGLKYTNNSFEWLDKTDFNYKHWSDDALKDGTNACVQMIITKSDSGKWIDESCNRKSLIVCQKKQFTTTVFVDDLKNLTKIVDKQQAKIVKQEQIEQNIMETIKIQNETNQALKERLKNQEITIEILKDNLTKLIPIGFIYTQLPGENAPSKIWPKMTWSDVSSSYAGVFFRVKGGNAANFGEKQSENSPGQYVKEVQPWRYCTHNIIKKISLESNGWSDWIFTGRNNGNSEEMCLRFNVVKSGGENRPINMAIRIWKRTA